MYKRVALTGQLLTDSATQTPLTNTSQKATTFLLNIHVNSNRTFPYESFIWPITDRLCHKKLRWYSCFPNRSRVFSQL